MSVEIKLKMRDDIQSLFQRCPKEAESAVKSALSKTAKIAKKTAIASTVKTYTAKHKAVADALYMRKSGSDLISLVFSGPKLRMSDFYLRPNKPGSSPVGGLFLRIRRDGGGQLPKHFVAKMDSGHIGAFIRIDPETKKGTKRLPISQGYGPSVPSMVKNPETIDKVEKESVRTYEEIFLNEFDKRLTRRSG